VATLQVKNLSDALHNELRTRAAEEGTTLSELVTRMIRRELALPSMQQWLAELDRAPAHAAIDSVGVLDEVRAESR
jgi:plasmid stability protein